VRDLLGQALDAMLGLAEMRTLSKPGLREECAEDVEFILAGKEHGRHPVRWC